MINEIRKFHTEFLPVRPHIETLTPNVSVVDKEITEDNVNSDVEQTNVTQEIAEESGTIFSERIVEVPVPDSPARVLRRRNQLRQPQRFV